MPRRRNQQTIRKEVRVRGVGFLTGADVTIAFHPAEAHTGIVFVRTDLAESARIPASLDHRIERPRRTSLQADEATVEMVEHVLAALSGLQIDNCEVHLNAPEPPGGDGSCHAFVEALHRAGPVALAAPRATLRVDRPVCVMEGPAVIAAVPTPDEQTLLSYHLDYGDESPIEPQSRFLRVSPERFAEDVAAARTFLLQTEADLLRAQGVGIRLTHKDLLIFGPDGPIDNILRFPDEPVRHKLLDLVGDLTLLGCDWQGWITGYRSGHRLNALLARELLQQCAVETEQPTRTDTTKMFHVSSGRDQVTGPHNRRAGRRGEPASPLHREKT